MRASGEKVFAPGDIEAGSRAAHSEQIELSTSTVELLDEAARSRGVGPLSAL